MHNVLPNAQSFIVHLERAARRAGADIRLNTRAIELLVKEGQVVAVDCDTPAGRCRFHARGGVVLATGDFTNDPELKARYMGPQEAKVDGVNVNATGDGQKLATRIGARIVNGDLALGPELRFIPPQNRNVLLKLPPWRALANLMAWSLDHLPSALLRPFVMSFVTTALAPSPNLFGEGAILVNSRGERFTDETDKPAYLVPDQPDKVAYILLDDRIIQQFSAWPHFISTAPGVAYAYVDDYRRNRPDVFASASTLPELATKLGMPDGSLTATVSDYNNRAGNRRTLGGGPYVALGPVRAVFVHAEGGLAVDREHRVLGPDDRPIPGLYAAGSAGQGGLLLKGHGHHLAWAFASGRRAGRQAAYATATTDMPS
jgi:fumarate reductase flavoprotein subunit